MAGLFSSTAQIDSFTALLNMIAEHLDLRLSVRLWNGDEIPLGGDVDPDLFISISGPGAIGALLRRPSLETLTLLYANGHIDFEGGNLLDVHAALETKGSSRKALRNLSKRSLVRNLMPFLFAKSADSRPEHRFDDDIVGRRESRRNNKDYIQFHYDVGNEFYQLFLDPEMQYSCGYFKDWDNSLSLAQLDKLEIICRKLRLAPGETMLDVGCGWGGLICYAAKHFGVRSHGITLSQHQYDHAQDKIRRLGLQNQVTVELRDYQDVDGSYDKIASIGMFEHIGVANYATYFGKLRSLLRDRGILLNHAIARSSKKSKRKARKIRPERKLLLKYIFPGSELTSAGFTQDSMEQQGFEVHDVESWREHYALTCRAWCQRLSANKEKAVELVGYQRYRLWVAYLAGASIGFQAGSIKIYQILATKKVGKGRSGLPPTRSDLYSSEPNQIEFVGAERSCRQPAG
jgi:cyclopropane-fatty-acyl-phospholipid synthase